METNGNNVIVKGLAIVLIAILGLNVYRTETTKKEMSHLTEAVEVLTSRLDSLEGVRTPAGRSAASVSKKEFANLAKSVASLESKVATISNTVNRISGNQNVAGASGIASGGTAAVTKPASSDGRVAVAAKVRVENRYVSGTTYLPKVTTGPVGVVVINVVVSRHGNVGSVSVNSGSTITDEDVIDACKEAALKTDFAYNPDAADKTRGTITYTFSAR